MLSQLTIQDFALVERLSVEFGPGFNVLTGETGAGKSILIDALDAALGVRLGPEAIRTGAERAQVEAVFEIDARSETRLAEWAEEGVLILGREIGRGGRSVFRINGRMCTASAVREVAAGLIDIHGQHEHQSLLATERHAEYLDGWAGAPVLDARTCVEGRYRALREVREALEALRRDERETAQRVDLYRLQVEEIDAAALEPGEEEQLAADQRLLANAEKLHAGSAAALASLGGGEPNAADLLAASAAELTSLAAVDERLAAIAEMVESAAVAAQEAGRELRSYHDAVEFNPERLAQVIERQEMLRRLRRKYGDTVDEILAYRDRIAAELDTLDHATERQEALAAREVELTGELAQAAQALWKARRNTAARFDAEVLAHLRDLSMEHTRFETRVEDGDLAAADRGLAFVLGRVEFLISANPGEPLRPLARIASGGEISRVMLALKSAMAAASPVPTLIFDEVDSGVGGRTAEVLGRKLAALAGENQVLCVTHLPQIACLAHTHFLVRKEAAGGRTRVDVEQLEGDSRVGELARMLGGAKTTATRHARQLLAAAGTHPAAV